MLLTAAAICLAGCAGAPPADILSSPSIASPAPAAPSAPSAPDAGQAPPHPAPAATAPAAIDLQGQLSIKLQATAELPAKGVSLGFFFHGQPEAGRLDLMTPLGSQIAQVGWGPSGAWLRRDGGGITEGPPESRFGTDLSAPSPTDQGVERFDSIQTLSERALGEAIPLQTLIHWMQGHADPARVSTPEPEGSPDAGTFTQDGWRIDTRDWPRRLQAQRAASAQLRGIQIKVHFDR